LLIYLYEFFLIALIYVYVLDQKTVIAYKITEILIIYFVKSTFFSAIGSHALRTTFDSILFYKRKIGNDF